MGLAQNSNWMSFCLCQKKEIDVASVREFCFDLLFQSVNLILTQLMLVSFSSLKQWNNSDLLLSFPVPSSHWSGPGSSSSSESLSHSSVLQLMSSPMEKLWITTAPRTKLMIRFMWLRFASLRGMHFRSGNLLFKILMQCLDFSLALTNIVLNAV